MERFSTHDQRKGSKVIYSENNQSSEVRSKSLSSLSPRQNRHKSQSTANGSLRKVPWHSPGQSSSGFTLQPATFNPSPNKPSTNYCSPGSPGLTFNGNTLPATANQGSAILTNGIPAILQKNTFQGNNIFSASHSSSVLDAVEAMDVDHQDDELPTSLNNKGSSSENGTVVMNGFSNASDTSARSTSECFISNDSLSSGEPKTERNTSTVGEGQQLKTHKSLGESSSTQSRNGKSKKNVENSENLSKSSEDKILNFKKTSRTQHKKKAIYIVLHVSKIQVGNVTGRATTPVKIYAEKIFIEMETDGGKETFNFKIPCKDLLSVKASLRESPFALIAQPSPQVLKTMSAKYKEKDFFLQLSDSADCFIILHMNYNRMPKEIKVDLVELFKERFANELKWEELTPDQAKEILNQPVVRVESASTTALSSPVKTKESSTKHPTPGSRDSNSPNGSYSENKPPITSSPSTSTCDPVIFDSGGQRSQRRYLSPRSSIKKKLSFAQQPNSSTKTNASPSLPKEVSITDSLKMSNTSSQAINEELITQRVTRSRRRKSSGNGNGGSSEKKPDIFHHQTQMENHITILGKHSKEQREHLHHHQKLLEEERAELFRNLERVGELKRDVIEKDVLLNQQTMTMEVLNRELQSQQATLRQLQQELEQERESANRMRKVQTDFVQTRRALDEEKVVRSLRDQQLQEKEALVVELQQLLSEETRLKSEVEAELRQVRDSYQLHQDELQNERISRQNRDRELEDKQVQLEEHRRQLEEERLRGTGLEEELRQLRLELAEERESRLATEREVQIDRNRLQEECNSRARELESYNQRLRESERITSEYEQRLQDLRSAVTAAQHSLDEYRRLEPRDWILRRDEVTVMDKTLGVGAWGNVVEGRFRGSKVAVKKIHELILSPHNRRLFEREMSIASRCRHPCLLQFIGATNDDGTPLFVTELLDTDLRSVLSQRSLLHEEIITISCDIAVALNYLHLNRPFPIIHRDISSSNVLLWKRNDCWRGKLSDYGAANFMRQSMTTMPGARIYAAPEAMTNQQSTKVDVYSFGLLLCEMCIRELPVPLQTQEQIGLVTNGVLRELIMRCVQTDPELRPSIADVIIILDRQYETIQAQELVAINSVSALV